MMLLRIFSMIVLCVIISLAEQGQVLTGIDVLEKELFSPLRGKRIGLITNHTGQNRNGVSTIDILFQAPDVKLIRLFAPEHGLRGIMDEAVTDDVDPKTQLPVISLYGKNRQPLPEHLADLDMLVFDIQDIGTRFYTYISTMAFCMRSAAENNKQIMVLDRPNPINGIMVSGLIPPDSLCGKFTAIYPIPTRHGMTIGELAEMFNRHFKIGAQLQVIPMQNWQRSMFWEETGLPWINPSPNMKTMTGAICYPGLGWLETTSLSMARGTEIPFEMYGAPYIDEHALFNKLKEYPIPGARIIPCRFLPTTPHHKFNQEKCRGLRIIITDRNRFEGLPLGLTIAQTLLQLYPNDYKLSNGTAVSLGSAVALEQLRQKVPVEEIIRQNQARLDEFIKIRQDYLKY
ncbi:MAG: DUF1343 domain-containing protein [Candidatus Delongbacteria bacterium]|nr:DUF1343 domain-containing protein [Candidatus Delongbacteria bacterium]